MRGRTAWKPSRRRSKPAVTVTVASFLQGHQEFSDASTDEDAAYYLALAGVMLSADRFGEAIDIATELFMAHHLSLEVMQRAEARRGGQPGAARGILSSASVDKVSYSYDTASVSEAGAGHWNLTIYGKRYWRLVQMFGAGPVQVGIGYAPTGSGAWPGPTVGPW